RSSWFLPGRGGRTSPGERGFPRPPLSALGRRLRRGRPSVCADLAFKPGLDGMTAIALRWLHPLVWLVLAVSFLVRGAGTQGAANVLALLGGITYACFLGTVVVATSKPTRRR